MRSRRRRRALNAFGVGGTTGHPRPGGSRRRLVRFVEYSHVPRREAETADENGEPEISRLAELAVEQGKEAGAIEQQGKKLAALQFAETEKAETERQHRPPDKERGTENRPA